MLTERTEVGKIEVLPDGTLQVRTDMVIERDGKEISRTYHRISLQADDDISTQTDEVKAIGTIVRTPERVRRARERRAESLLNPLGRRINEETIR